MRNNLWKNRLFHPKFAREWGQSMAFVVLALPAFVGAMGLATDVGNFYYNYYKLQGAVDSAALAGAKCLPSGAGCNGTCGTGATSSCTPSQTATYYATTLNGVLGGEVTGPTVTAGNTQITIGATRTVPYYFARLVGANSGTLSVSATAQAGKLGTANNPFLIGLQVCGDASVPACATPYSVGETLTFNEKGTAPGNWQPLALLGGGTSVSVCATGPGCIDSNTGCAAAKSLRDSAQSRIDAGNAVDPAGTALSHTADDPRAVAVPLVDWSSGVTGTKPMNVYGFAEIWLNSVTNPPGCAADPVINATFISQASSGEIDTGGGAFDVGATTIKLIQ